MSFLLFIIFLFIIFPTILIAFFLGKKNPNRSFFWIISRTIGYSFLAVVGSLIALIIFIQVLVAIDEYREYKISEEIVLANCKNGAKIYSATYKSKSDEQYFAENRQFVYYQKNDKIIGLNFDLESSDLVKKNPNKNFEKNKDTSVIGSFPNFNFMQKDWNYSVTDKASFEESNREIVQHRKKIPQDIRLDKDYMSLDGAGLNAVYVNPEKISQQGFDEMVECVRENINQLQQNNELQQNIKLHPRDIFVYDLERKIDFDGWKVVNFSELLCENSENKVIIKNSGIVKFIVNDKYTEEHYIGYFDLDGNFVREKSIDSNFNYNLPDAPISLSYKNVGFERAYNESKSLKLLFNQNQEPINYYLQTCKNDQGKTIFDIFKN